MSKSTMIMMAILLIAFGSMLVAAELVIGPMEKDVGLAKELSGDLDNRGWLLPDKPRPDDRVRVRTVKGGTEGRLAARPDWGVIVEVKPAIETLTAKDRLSYVARVVLDRVDVISRQGRALHWVELVFHFEDTEVVRTLIERHTDGTWRDPEPPIPSTWDPTQAPVTTADAR